MYLSCVGRTSIPDVAGKQMYRRSDAACLTTGHRRHQRPDDLAKSNTQSYPCVSTAMFCYSPLAQYDMYVALSERLSKSVESLYQLVVATRRKKSAVEVQRSLFAVNLVVMLVHLSTGKMSNMYRQSRKRSNGLAQTSDTISDRAQLQGQF